MVRLYLLPNVLLMWCDFDTPPARGVEWGDVLTPACPELSQFQYCKSCVSEIPRFWTKHPGTWSSEVNLPSLIQAACDHIRKDTCDFQD